MKYPPGFRVSRKPSSSQSLWMLVPAKSSERRWEEIALSNHADNMLIRRDFPNRGGRRKRTTEGVDEPSSSAMNMVRSKKKYMPPLSIAQEAIFMGRRTGGRLFSLFFSARNNSSAVVLASLAFGCTLSSSTELRSRVSISA